MRYILVYNFYKAYLFQVDIITMKNPVRANRVLIKYGNYKEVVDLAISKCKGNHVRTANCDRNGNIFKLPWKRGVGDLPGRTLVCTKSLLYNRRNYVYSSY